MLALQLVEGEGSFNLCIENLELFLSGKQITHKCAIMLQTPPASQQYQYSMLCCKIR